MNFYLKTAFFIITTLCIVSYADDIESYIHNVPYANHNIDTFYKAKRALYWIYKDHPITFYCGCTYYKYNYRKYKPVLDSCGYEIRHNERRAQRIEAEHIVPAYILGKDLPCWKIGGRRYCRQRSKEFRTRENDLHNLVPAIGEINEDRSNYTYAVIPGEKRDYGSCNVEIDTEHHTIEPKPSIRGDIARIYLYMVDKYHLKIPQSQMTLYHRWDKKDPMDLWEYIRSIKIDAIYNDHNLK